MELNKSKENVSLLSKRRRRLCLEIDGEYHDNQIGYDANRDLFLIIERGLRVLRISNKEALTLDASKLDRLMS